jgi:hypothetical protein
MNVNPLTAIGPLLCPMLAFAIVAIIIVLIVRAAMRSSSGGGPVVSSPTVLTELAKDGFWITSCPVEPGSIIHFAYWLGGTRHTGQVPFQPDNTGRQFVYTGARPEQVSITRIVEPSDDVVSDIIPPIISTPGPFWDSSSGPPSSSSSSGFPSAY